MEELEYKVIQLMNELEAERKLVRFYRLFVFILFLFFLWGGVNCG